MTEDITERVAFPSAMLSTPPSSGRTRPNTPEAAEDELSNVLSQLYRLREVVKDKLGKGFHKAMLASDDRRITRAATWARTFDAHDAVVVAQMADISTDYCADMHVTLASAVSIQLTPIKSLHFSGQSARR